MPHGFDTAILAGLGGMIGWGLADFFAKITIDRIGDTVSLVWAHVCGTLLLGVVFVAATMSGYPLALPTDFHTWFALAFFGALQGAVYLYAYRGFGKGQVAVLNPIFASFTGLVALVSIVWLGEKGSDALQPILLVIFLGVMLLATDFKALRQKGLHLAHVAGFREVALATLMATLWTVLWKLFITGGDWLADALIMYVWMTLTVLIYARYTKTKLRGVPARMWLFLLLIGISEVVAYAAISLGYATSSYTSIVALVSGAFSLPTILLAHYFLKERTSALQRAGMALVIIGVVLLPLV